MKKYLFVVLVVLLTVVTAGCGQRAEEAETTEEGVLSESEQTAAEEEATDADTAGESLPGEDGLTPEDAGADETVPGADDPAAGAADANSVESRLEGLIGNEYEGLEISAAILPRMAILPGATVPITVVIKNTGDQTIAYAQGSGSYETPEALLLDGGGLQWIRPQDQLGVVTSDFMMKELKPSEELTVTLFIRVTQPNPEFDRYTNELFDQDGVYIGDMEWEALQEAYPDLEAAEPGSYEGAVYLRYRIADEEEGFGLFGDNTGYAKADFIVGVNG